MSEAWISVLGSVVVGLLTLLGVLASNSRAQAVTETRWVLIKALFRRCT